jgi:hypothetical protein
MGGEGEEGREGGTLDRWREGREKDWREVKQLLRDMLFRMRRMELLVFELLKVRT